MTRDNWPEVVESTAKRGRMPRGGVVGFSPDALRRAMDRADMTADELAGHVGVSRQAVDAWLRGRAVPSPKSLHKVADFLELEPGSLTPGRTRKPQLVDLRTRAGLTQAAAAEALGISATTLRGAEQGLRKNSDSDLVDALAQIYRTTPDEVLEAWQLAVAKRAEWLVARNAARRLRK